MRAFVSLFPTFLFSAFSSLGQRAPPLHKKHFLSGKKLIEHIHAEAELTENSLRQIPQNIRARRDHDITLPTQPGKHLF